MDGLVKEQLDEMLDVFESLPDCKIKKTEGDRLFNKSLPCVKSNSVY